jgi:hypothetical protein
MLNDYGKSLFQPLLSVPNIVLCLSAAFVLALALMKVELTNSEWASWVQAVGAIVSIWAAWVIASRQSRRAEKAAMRQDSAKCAAIVGVLNYALNVIEQESLAENGSVNPLHLRADIEKILSMFDRIDLLAIPDPVVVNAVCAVRRSIELLDKKLIEHRGTTVFALHYRFGLARACISTTQHQILLCEVAIAELNS